MSDEYTWTQADIEHLSKSAREVAEILAECIEKLREAIEPDEEDES